MKSYNIIVIIFVMLLVGVMSACEDDRYESKKETVKYDNIKELDVSNVTGSISITGWDKDYVEVTYTKKAKHEDDLDEIDVDIDQRGDALYIVTDLPWHCKGCAVEYDIFIPQKFNSIKSETVTGSVDVRKIDYVDELITKSTTGSIDAEASACIVEANVVTGSVKLYLNDIADNGEIDAETVTGSIKIYAPADLSADIDASAVTGSVNVDYDIDNIRVKKKNKLRGTVGDGDIKCNMSTITGSIYIGTK